MTESFPTKSVIKCRSNVLGHRIAKKGKKRLPIVLTWAWLSGGLSAVDIESFCMAYKCGTVPLA